MTGPLLIVDDNDELRELLDAALTERGESVITAQHGGEAIERVDARGVRPWLVLLDLHMPVMDGIAFLAASAAHPLLSHVPVVIMTSDAAPPTDLPTVVRTVLGKPVPLARLIATIDQLATERRAPSPTRLANGTGAVPERPATEPPPAEPDAAPAALADQPALFAKPIED